MSTDTEYEWRQGLKVGDEVIVCRTLRPDRIESVTRSTRTQISAGRSIFSRKEGTEKGTTGWYSSRIFAPIGERLENAKRATIIDKLKYAKWDELPIDRLQAAYDAMTGAPG